MARPSSGGSYQGSRGLDQLSSPMRSRVEIVARKSDHICVVRDVPDMRGSWYPRQQMPGSSSGSSAGAGGYQPSGGSLDHPLPPQLQPPPPSQPSSSGSAAPSKPSFAALFGKHPAIKEEPTTPGGTLTSETPPPSGLGLAGKRGPLKTSTTTTTAAAAISLPTTSNDQLSQLMSLVTELKSELKQELGQLTKRLDSMDTSVGRVTQTVARLDRHCTQQTPRQTQPAEPSIKDQPQPPLGYSTKSLADKPAGSDLSSARSRLSQSQQLDATVTTAATSTSTLPPAAAATEGSASGHHRESSKSPHRHHHHHHHHHHRKATHPTPTVSQTDLRQVGGSSSGKPAVESKALEPQAATRLPSFEQSDDDQDATSKL